MPAVRSACPTSCAVESQSGPAPSLRRNPPRGRKSSFAGRVCKRGRRLAARDRRRLVDQLVVLERLDHEEGEVRAARKASPGPSGPRSWAASGETSASSSSLRGCAARPVRSRTPCSSRVTFRSRTRDEACGRPCGPRCLARRCTRAAMRPANPTLGRSLERTASVGSLAPVGGPDRGRVGLSRAAAEHEDHRRRLERDGFPTDARPCEEHVPGP
jgi:hypothetical protein